jgi:hypothetical protein
MLNKYKTNIFLIGGDSPDTEQEQSREQSQQAKVQLPGVNVFKNSFFFSG